MIRLSTHLLPLLATMGFTAAPASASALPDTVIGVAHPHYGGEPMDWTPERFVRIRNLQGATIKVPPPIHEPVYRQVTGSQGEYPYPWIHSVRKYAGGLPRISEYVWGGDTLTLAAGDSLDFGLFQIGPLAVPKRSASAPPLQGHVGDTVRVPMAIRFGSDSLRFILKTKIAETIIGSPNPVYGLVGDRDTVFGVDQRIWDPQQEWERPNFIRIKNRHARTLVVDSIRLPSDSIPFPGAGYRRMDQVFAVRTYAGGVRVTPVLWEGLKRHPITLAIGDSADFGMFQVGSLQILIKQSAAARRYQIGDTLTAPVTLFAGTDSLRFILKAKVAAGLVGSAIAPTAKPGPGGNPAATLAVSADGRRDREKGYAKRILFMAPEPGTASRPR